MMAIPQFLEPVQVTAMACAGKPNLAPALALLEQARAGLLTTVVAREAKPASLVLYMYERVMDGTSERIDQQRVWMDSTYRSAVSFSAVRSAPEFVRLGFMADSPNGSQVFYAPDADVLLDDRFTIGYCFRVVPPNKDRPNQIGLGFEAEKRKTDRIDIEGVLWIDTAARALKDIEFKYMGLSQRLQMFEPGGKISFREMPNGVVLVDRWNLRLIGAVHDTVDRNPVRPRVNIKPYMSESGGELAHAAWHDGLTWQNQLGMLDLRITTRAGKAWPGVTVRFAHSPYQATSDATARIVMRDLVPGPYTALVVDSLLAPINLRIPTDLWFLSRRDSVALTLKVPTTEEFVLDRCIADRTYRPGAAESMLVIARVTTRDGHPLGDAKWSARTKSAESLVDYKLLRDGGRTGTDGLLTLCSGVSRYGVVEISVEHEQLGRATIRRKLDERVTVIWIPLGG
jgi:hypothetical protein